MKTVKVLILGSEGFVGHNLVRGLKDNFEIIASDMINFSDQNVKYVKADITQFNEIKSISNGVDVIINLVAHTLVSSFDQIITNAQVNIIGMLNVLEAARLNNIKKIIFPSASSMIGIAKENPVTEQHPATPKTAYGVSKLACEHYLRIYKELYDMNYVVFRFFNIYGPYQANGLIPNIFSKLKKNEPITVFGKGDQMRDYVYIEDMVKYFSKAITSNIADNQVINMGTGQGATVKDVIELASKQVGIQPKIDYKPERPGEITNFVADTKLLRALFGSVPSTPLDEGLRLTHEWLNGKQ